MLSRLAAAVILAVFAFQAVGVSAAAAMPCLEQCEDDGPDGQCAPTCEDCFCCAHPRAAVAAPAAMPVPGGAVLRRSFFLERQPPQPDAGEILRIPKSLVGRLPFADRLMA
jgi:hypothetical protein